MLLCLENRNCSATSFILNSLSSKGYKFQTWWMGKALKLQLN
jgi:hypothetical protein